MSDISDERIVMGHGGGGELTHRLITGLILPKLGNRWLDPLTDSALLDRPSGRVCVTTDAYVVTPIEFPGGDIGRLSVCGTVNDLAVMGAQPLGLTLALVIEEGLPVATLSRIVDSIAAAAAEANTLILTGDTKVVERRTGEGLTITTAGVGVVAEDVQLGIERVQAGDAIIINGGIAEHGLTVMAQRQSLGIRTGLTSDAAPLNGLLDAVLACGADVKFMRDATRGGLAGVVADLAEASGLTVELDEQAIPIMPATQHLAEMLGFDPLVVANEGKAVIVVAREDADKVVATLRAHELGLSAAVIGRVTDAAPPLAELVTTMGGRRMISRPHGEQLPRIC